MTWSRVLFLNASVLAATGAVVLLVQVLFDIAEGRGFEEFSIVQTAAVAGTSACLSVLFYLSARPADTST